MATKKRRPNKKKLLLQKAQEAAMAAIQIFNNPQVMFKTEIFIVLMIIAWRKLLHAYYHSTKIDGKKIKYHYEKKAGDKIVRYWDLVKCLDETVCPAVIDEPMKSNLKFLINLRNQIEHDVSYDIAQYASGKLQACCMNIAKIFKRLFDMDLASLQPLSLQLFGFSNEQVRELNDRGDVPSNILDFINRFEGDLDDEVMSSEGYSYKVLFTPVIVNNRGQADKTINFIKSGSEENKAIQEILVKEVTRKEITQKEVVQAIKKHGYAKFTERNHQNFWKTKWKDKKMRDKKAMQFGKLTPHKQWVWFENTWLPEVINHCESQGGKYK